MTARELAHQIIAEVNFMPHDDAVAIITAQLELFRAQAERSGIEQVRQALFELQPVN